MYVTDYAMHFDVGTNHSPSLANAIFHTGLKYDDADLSAALMAEILPELAHATDIQIVLPSKKALRRFPCATILPRPTPATLNAQSLLSDCIHRNVVEIADLAMRRLPMQVIELDRRLESKLPNRKTDEAKWQTRILTLVMRQRPSINESEARVAIIQHALHIQNRVSSSIATKSVEQGRHSHTSLRESDTPRTSVSLTNFNESKSNNPAANAFNVRSSKSSCNQIPDSLLIPSTSRSSNSNATELQITHKQSIKGRFSIKLNWSSKSNFSSGPYTS